MANKRVTNYCLFGLGSDEEIIKKIWKKYKNVGQNCQKKLE